MRWTLVEHKGIGKYFLMIIFSVMHTCIFIERVFNQFITGV